jgi:hypothetical protein
VPDVRVSAAVYWSLAFTLITTALGALDAPAWLWIITLVVAALFLALGVAGLPSVQRRFPSLVELPLVEDRVGETLKGLDDVCVYIIRTQRTIEVIHVRQRANPNYTPGPFVAPLGQGRYGRYDFDVARRGFVKLQELGIIEPAAYEIDNPHFTEHTEYRWTDFGKAVGDRLIQKYPLDDKDIQRAVSKYPTP